MINYCYKREEAYCVFENGLSFGFWITPKDDRYTEVESYLAAHPEALVPEPVPPPPTQEQKLRAEESQLLVYLASTDWYSSRKIRTGKAIPQEVLDACDVATERISEIRKALAKLNT